MPGSRFFQSSLRSLAPGVGPRSPRCSGEALVLEGLFYHSRPLSADPSGSTASATVPLYRARQRRERDQIVL